MKKKSKPKASPAAEALVKSPEQLAEFFNKHLPHWNVGDKAGMTTGAVTRIRQGTRWPRPAAFFRLVELTGFELVLRQKARG